jgi:transposase
LNDAVVLASIFNEFQSIFKTTRIHKPGNKNIFKVAVFRQPRLTVGMVTTAILIGLHLDPRHFGCARSYLKALGLNLKEKSSGQDHGKLKLTKRGSALARKYLYFAALRLINSDPVISAWYQNKVDPRAKLKTVIALMRKLAKALWHVARGQRFDARKLVMTTEVN